MKELREFRKKKKLSQVRFAKKIGVSQSMYEKVERGVIPPSRAFMEKIKLTYPEVNIDFIFFNI
ncbi:helix-turn-helix domain-containing protein [Bacillus mycoides]|uniref:helix-turn-helix domain-containing protein n=1 Tax=Bacillus mycoides TaxID=1405 RepID=UPI003F7BFAFD